MDNKKYFPPKFADGQYHCPHCGVFSKQLWAHVEAHHIWGADFVGRSVSVFSEQLSEDWRISKCVHCGDYMIWSKDSIIYPNELSVEEPNSDLGDEIKKDYLEAANILNKSPRGSAALLRLALQKLMKQLGESGDNMNEDIKSLIKKGLNSTVQHALDIVRVTGNNAVHPGQLDLDDNKEIAEKLFKVINFISQKTLTEPKEIEDLFAELPEDEKEKIEERNKKIV